MFDDAIVTDDNGCSGSLRHFMRALHSALHRFRGQTQIVVTRLFDRSLIHGFSLQSSSTGSEPALSYKAHASTHGA